MNLDKQAINEWHNLNEYVGTRREEISRTFEPLVEAANSYEKLACRFILALGKIKSFSNKDDTYSDLFAEAFDALRNAKGLTLEWSPSSSVALLRRAYEVTSLLVYLLLNPSQIEHWENGNQISPKAIRASLAKHPMGEPEDQLREFYSILSTGTHVNRVYVLHRHLGRGNEFTLGSVGRPHMVTTAQHFLWLISIWFWLMAATVYHYMEALQDVDPDFGHKYMEVSKQAQEVVAAVEGQWNKLVAFDARS